MFTGIAVDGLTSFVAGQSSHVDLDIQMMTPLMMKTTK
jgi:hypothetical protein